jgi:predicted metal-dependent phosphoesterase TrpH
VYRGELMFNNIEYKSERVTASPIRRDSLRHFEMPGNNGFSAYAGYRNYNGLNDAVNTEGYESKFCTPEEAETFIEDGWAAADLHVHTWCSYDVLPLKEMDPLVIYEKARQRGFRFITFTDHDTMDAYDRVGWTREGIVPGVEIKIFDPKRVGHTMHINVYQLNKKQFLELEDIAAKDKNIETFVNYLRDNDLPYIYNHPFWFERSNTPNLPAVFEVSELFPVLEYNMGRVNILNRMATKLAEHRGAGLAAGSDTHTGDIGKNFTIAGGETFREFYNEIKAGRSFIMPQDMTRERLMQEVSIRIHHLFSREKWMFDKPSFHIDSGIKFLDRLIDKLVKSSPKDYRFFKKISHAFLDALNHSRIPASLHIKSQMAIGKKIKRLNRDLSPVPTQDFQARWAH